MYVCMYASKAVGWIIAGLTGLALYHPADRPTTEPGELVVRNLFGSLPTACRTILGSGTAELLKKKKKGGIPVSHSEDRCLHPVWVV